MRAEDLKVNELVGFSQAQLMFLDRRLVVSDLRAFAQFGKDLLDMVGVEHARRILTRYGYFWGQADAQAMKRLFKWDSLTELLRAGARLQTLQGIGKVVGTSLWMDEESGHCRMEVTWHNSGTAEGYVDQIGIADHPVCWINTGYATGYASYCIGRPVYFIEQKCKGKGDDYCIAVGADAETWGAELESYLPYFQADDIQGKIESLTAELLQKNRELESQRDRASGKHGDSGDAEISSGRSSAYRQVIESVKRVGPLSCPVLLTGEPGAGKHYVAKLLCRISSRASAPLETVHCGVLSGTLLESLLFGHAAGAFPGASRDSIGILESNSEGTVFLDEIEHTSPETQMKLLRVIKAGELIRMGESTPRKTNVRIIAASEADLRELVRRGKLRAELYYRLGATQIHIPPLRERPEDILPMARAMLKNQRIRLELRNTRLDPMCLDYLLEYDWPGNVRELEYVISRAALLAKKGVITPECLPGNVRGANSEPDLGEYSTLAQVEQAHIRSVMKSVKGNRKRAAEILGIGLTTLWRKLKDMGME